jgi:hypothetical protein
MGAGLSGNFFAKSNVLLEPTTMTPEVERFLDLATRPLEATPHEREEAKGELMSRLAHGGVPYELLDLAEPLERLEKTGPRAHALRRTTLLSSALLLAAAVVAATAFIAWEVFLMSQAAMMSFRMGGGIAMHHDEDGAVLKHARSLAPTLPLGLHPAAGTAEETVDQMARHPDDLAMLQEHISRSMSVTRGTWNGFAPDEEKTINRLDRDNALWPLMQVTPHMALAMSSSSRSSAGPAVTNEAEFQKALRYFSDAAGKPHYRDWSTSLKRRQLAAFPPVHSLSAEIVASGFTRMVSPPLARYSEGLSSLIRIQFERLSSSGDKAGLVKFFGEWKQLTRNVTQSAEPSDPEYSDVVQQLAAIDTSAVDAFDKLGMAEEKAEAEKWHEALVHVSFRYAPMPAGLESSAGMRLRSENRLPNGVTPDEALPSRRAELAFFDRMITGFLSIVALVFAGLIGFETCRRSRIVKGMARGLTPLFRNEDHLWIAGLGIALPWLWWWTIARMSPLGLRDGNLNDGWPIAVCLIQSSAALIFGMVMLLQTARWRWGLRGGFIGLGVTLPWIGWGVATLTGLSIPAAGIIRYLHTLNDDETAIFFLGVSGMAASGLLWLLWQGIMTLFTPRSGALRPNLTMRAALPWALAGVATLLVSAAVSTAMERHWFTKDPLFPPWTSKTHSNALKERMAGEIREAVRDL